MVMTTIPMAQVKTLKAAIDSVPDGGTVGSLYLAVKKALSMSSIALSILAQEE